MDGEVDCDYIVVGSGAGGGTLAARLAEAGYRVVVLEAGGDPRSLKGGSPAASGANRLPDDYDVPVFHPFASENSAMKWDFYVRHYGSDAAQKRDPKYRETVDGKPVDGVLYPRAGTLGGCTAHNALILVYPHDADWNGIAELTGDASWRAENMRRYFERLEDCRHRPLWRLLAKLGLNPTRHGWKGWLRSEKAIPRRAFGDRRLMDVILSSADAAFGRSGLIFKLLRWIGRGAGDPNDWRLLRTAPEDVCYTPMTTRRHQRTGTRERLLETARRFPERLRIELNALATRVLLDGENRAVGVEYLSGERLYRAHDRPSELAGERRVLRAAREVIVAGGAFNTPQLLMLSGIGPAAELDRHGIPVRVDLPGVGKNLQDRYEVAVVNRMNFPCWQVLEGARFAPGDSIYRQWASERDGMYATNGAGLAVIARSAPHRPLPDLFCMAFLGLFKGYFPNYSALLPAHLNYLSWCVLKAHTSNRAGEVTLRSADPRDPPRINFRYFEEGDDKTGDDLDAVVHGIRFARAMTKHLKAEGLIAEEELPGDAVQSTEELRSFVRDQAWGHHASCSCAIGPREARGVVDTNFRVHGARGLRVVDASVFPHIPGFFIASAIYVIAEKAADAILADAAGGAQPGSA